MHDAMCDASDVLADLTCVLPEDHTGGHYDPEQGEWANGTDWCPAYQERHGHKHFCIYKRNHPGNVHMHPVVGLWDEPLGTCPGIGNPEQEDPGRKGLREVVVWPEKREALKRARMARRNVTKP